MAHISESGTNMALFKRTTQHATDAPGYLCVEAQRDTFLSAFLMSYPSDSEVKCRETRFKFCCDCQPVLLYVSNLRWVDDDKSKPTGT